MHHIAVYISGHGYGHLAQIAPVLNRLSGLFPDIHFLLRTALPEWLIRSKLSAPFTPLPGDVDVGVVQKNAIDEDVPATIATARKFYSGFDNRIHQEIEQLKQHRPVAVLSDISPLAFPVAKRLSIPSVAVASLDWLDIYRDFMPAGDSVLHTLQQAHADCDLLIQPPLCMPMQSFTRRCQVELIVDDQQTLSKKKKNGPKTALIMFGGAGDPPFDVQALGKMPDWQFLSLSPQPASAPANVRQADLNGSTAAVMAECDVVVTKPGYGTLAECWLTETPLIYLPRENFSEYPYLDAWLQSEVPAARLSPDDFACGHWRPAMQQALNCPRTYPDIPASGALQAAELIAEAIG